MCSACVVCVGKLQSGPAAVPQHTHRDHLYNKNDRHTPTTTVTIKSQYISRGAQSSVFTRAAAPRFSARCTSDLSYLGPRELEHNDLTSLMVRDEDFVAVNKDFRDITLQIDANTLQDVA